jgi:formate hydrogenlyase subunit 3/multisubunit Na+/H+ antiporter MnhD subunit
METTPGGWLLVLALVLPAAAMLLAFLAGGRAAARVSVTALCLGFGLAVAIAWRVQQGGAPLVYLVGGWAPPLGLALRADGLSAAMLLTGAIVLLAVAWFGRAAYATPAPLRETRAALAFWCFLPALGASLAAAFLGGDLFNLFVALEMLTFTALALACLDGKPSQFKSELRYLLFALIGSVLYLLGTALLYGAYGTLDIMLLAGRTRADAPTMMAGALMTTGLIAKMALFPLHLWLPPAHAGAPPAGSALLSGLVVKGALVLLLRLWFWVLPAEVTAGGSALLAALGAAAILIGSVVALRQERLKLLIAYSTVAQMGYLFLMFPILAAGDADTAARAWLGGVLQAVSHALAKAAMFLGAGLVGMALGHDRVAGLCGAARAMPVTVIALAIAGLSLMGLPPSGGFSAKWLLLRSSIETGQWWWSLVILSGGLLTGGYVYRIVSAALGAPEPGTLKMRVGRGQEVCVLTLALMSALLGVLPLYAFGLVLVGAPGLR